MLELIARLFCKPVRSYQARVLRRWQDGNSLLVQLLPLTAQLFGATAPPTLLALPGVTFTPADIERLAETVMVSARSYRVAVAGEIVLLKDYAMGIRGKPTITVLEACK